MSDTCIGLFESDVLKVDNAAYNHLLSETRQYGDFVVMHDFQSLVNGSIWGDMFWAMGHYF